MDLDTALPCQDAFSTMPPVSKEASPDLKDAPAGPGKAEKKKLSHPDYQRIQDMWHSTLNKGSMPADYAQHSNKKVWLHCPGCIHGCGRRHEWQAVVYALTRQGQLVCPVCSSSRGATCPCCSVAADPRLSREWHASNPPADQVAKNSGKVYLWECLEGHGDYSATCHSRSHGRTGCPVCGNVRRGTTRHPKLAVGRPELAAEWDSERNDSGASPATVTLGSRHMAWWRCSRDKDHPSWQARVFSRAVRGQGCPECARSERGKPRN